MKKTTSTTQWVLLCGWILFIQPVWRQSGVLQAAELEKIITPHTV